MSRIPDPKMAEVYLEGAGDLSASDAMELQLFLQYLEELKLRNDRDKLAGWWANLYDKQREFVQRTDTFKVLMGGNQIGKTSTEAFEISCHLTGRYPKDWTGRRVNRPVEIWIAGETSTRVRDTVQEKLFGPIGREGFGFIPGDALDGQPIRKAGIPYAIDKAFIKHASGGSSLVQFFSYDMQREKFQGSTVDFIWFDEEPPEDIESECRMRILAKKGQIIYTFTPLKGNTPLHERLVRDSKAYKMFISQDEVPHIDKDMQAELFAGLDESEIKARKHGIASFSTGIIYTQPQDTYVIPRSSFRLESHWKTIGALDVGINHPTAALKAAIDPESGVVYVFQEYLASDRPSYENAMRIKDWNCPFVCDPSSWNRSISSGTPPIKDYMDLGLVCIKADNNVATGINTVRSMLQRDKLVFTDDLVRVLKEMRLYRRNEKGDIIKLNDDLVDTVRYLCMGIKYAQPQGQLREPDIVIPDPINNGSLLI